MAKLIWNAELNIRRFILLSIYTGRRATAILELTWTRVDLDRGTIRFRADGEHETNKRRGSIRIPRQVWGRVRRWKSFRGTDVVTYPAAVCDGAMLAYLESAEAIVVGYAFVVARYGDGTATKSKNWGALIGRSPGNFQASNNDGERDRFYNVSVRKNGRDETESENLPFQKSLISAEQRSSTTSSKVRIGAGEDTVTVWLGPIFEALLLSSEPSEADRQRVEGCMAWRNGLQDSLPSDHPYKSAAPQVTA